MSLLHLCSLGGACLPSCAHPEKQVDKVPAARVADTFSVFAYLFHACVQMDKQTEANSISQSILKYAGGKTATLEILLRYTHDCLNNIFDVSECFFVSQLAIGALCTQN